LKGATPNGLHHTPTAIAALRSGVFYANKKPIAEAVGVCWVVLSSHSMSFRDERLAMSVTVGIGMKPQTMWLCAASSHQTCEAFASQHIQFSKPKSIVNK